MTSPITGGRRAGMLIPLFSIPSSDSWGIGEIPDLVPLSEWLASAGQRLVQLLPINEMPSQESSPYSSLSAMAIDPQFIAPGHVEDVVAIGGERALGTTDRRTLQRIRAAAHVLYPDVRRLKTAVLALAWARFRDEALEPDTPRGRAFREYCRTESWWLDDYALFRALRARSGERPWLEWPAPLRDRDQDALASARTACADEIGYRSYLQWVAQQQWQSMRTRIAPVELFGDLPFTVATDSADVWARQREFRLDVSVGVPPDAFSATGQDWGLPACRWDVMAAADFPWLRDRARRYAALYDGFRVDHLVGFYRTYYRTTSGGEGQFTPDTEEAQTALGERVLDVFRSAGARVTAEDLGTVPDFVRASLVRLGVAGYKVFRWEREWHRDGQPYVDPVSYPPISVATSGTHDTEPGSVWWAGASLDERRAVLAVPSVRAHLTEAECLAAEVSAEWPDAARDAVLEALNAAASELLILPFQDPFGWSDRVNEPATVNDRNWTWRLPWPVDALATQPDALRVARRLRAWAERYRR